MEGLHWSRIVHTVTANAAQFGIEKLLCPTLTRKHFTLAVVNGSYTKSLLNLQNLNKTFLDEDIEYFADYLNVVADLCIRTPKMAIFCIMLFCSF